MTSFVAELDAEPMSEHEKSLYRTRARYETYKKVRELFNKLSSEKKLNQKTIAARLGISPSLVSRRLSGQANVTMDTLCDLARAMDARLETNVIPLSEVRPAVVTTVSATSTNSLPDHLGMACWQVRAGKASVWTAIRSTDAVNNGGGVVSSRDLNVSSGQIVDAQQLIPPFRGGADDVLSIFASGLTHPKSSVQAS